MKLSLRYYWQFKFAPLSFLFNEISLKFASHGWIGLLYLSVRTCPVTGQFSGPYFTVLSPKFKSLFNWNVSPNFEPRDNYNNKYPWLPVFFLLGSRLDQAKKDMVCNWQYGPWTHLIWGIYCSLEYTWETVVYFSFFLFLWISCA